jgi:hypothetical protein
MKKEESQTDTRRTDNAQGDRERNTNSVNPDRDNDMEDLSTIIKEDTSRNSTGATINTQRLAQDDSYTIISQTTEGKRNEELLNEAYVGEADKSKQTASSEVVTMGENSIEDQDDLGIVMGTEADVTEEDLLVLGEKDQDMDGGDDEMFSKAGLDDTDFEGEPLNEAATDMSSTGEDLDLPEETPNNPKGDAMGQGDEENDYYSLGSDNNDEVVEGTP